MGDYGICRLPVVPLRSKPAHSSEMISQLLYGESYQIVAHSQDLEWLQIVHSFDGYSGWLNSLQHHSISEEYYHQTNNTDLQIVAQRSAQAEIQSEVYQLPMGSIFPLSSPELFTNTGHFSSDALTKPLSQRLEFRELADYARIYLNTPYLWGGRTPWGIDCSGFVQQVFRLAGYALPRDSYQQARHGSRVNTWDLQKPGDLAFFASDGNKINHVGIILEENRIIHASGKVRIDSIEPAGIVVNKMITHKMNRINRVLK